ncbi:MAG: heme exporter protein CcmD [Burkholderiales bacterium]
MQWGSVSNFLAMGGYGGYVWGAFGVTLVLMVGEIVTVVRQHRAARSHLARSAKREAMR